MHLDINTIMKKINFLALFLGLNLFALNLAYCPFSCWPCKKNKIKKTKVMPINPYSLDSEKNEEKKKERKNEDVSVNSCSLNSESSEDLVSILYEKNEERRKERLRIYLSNEIEKIEKPRIFKEGGLKLQALEQYKKIIKYDALIEMYLLFVLRCQKKRLERPFFRFRTPLFDDLKNYKRDYKSTNKLSTDRYFNDVVLNDIVRMMLYKGCTICGEFN